MAGNDIERQVFLRRLIAITVLCVMIVAAVIIGWLLGRRTPSTIKKAALLKNETQLSWCISKPGITPEMLGQNIDYACQFVNCEIIRPGGMCYMPEIPALQASAVMNEYFQNNGKNQWNCDFSGTGVITSTDPSYGNCVLAYSKD